jgi:hypothetical protein
MYYSYVEIEYVATSFSPARTDLALKLLKEAILSDPCIQRFNYRKLTVLRSDFSAQGFGFVLLQPGNNEASVQAALDYCDGKGFSFMTKDSKAILRPVCFGAH